MNVQIVYSGKTFGNPHNKIFETLMGIQEPEHDPDGQRVLHQLELEVDALVDSFKNVSQTTGILADHTDEVSPAERAAVLDEVKRIDGDAHNLSQKLMYLALDVDDPSDMDAFAKLDTTVRRVLDEVLQLRKSPLLRAEPKDTEQKSQKVATPDLAPIGKQVEDLCDEHNRLAGFMNKVHELDEAPSPADALMMDILLTELLQKEQYLYNKLHQMLWSASQGTGSVIHGMLRPMHGVWQNASRMRADLRDMVDMPQDFVALYQRYGDLCVAVRYLKEDRPDKLNGTTAEDVIGYANGQAKRAKYLAAAPQFRGDKGLAQVMDRVAKKFSELAEETKKFLDKPATTEASDGKQELSAYLAAMLDEMEQG